MELRQLKYFLSVADARSFVRAAAEQYVSRQAISKAVSLLEEELHTELFMRDSSGAFLTPAGVMFYERVRNAVMELEQLRQEMQQLGSRFQQTIRLAFSIGTMALYEDILQAYLSQQSNLSVTSTECAPQMCSHLLTEREVDAIVTSATLNSTDFQLRPLLRSPYGLVTKKGTQMPSSLPIACFADGQTELYCSRWKLTPTYTGIDLARLIRMVAEEKCALVLPRCLFPVHMEQLQFSSLPSEDAWQLSLVCLPSLDHNALFHDAMETLLSQVFLKVRDEA